MNQAEIKNATIYNNHQIVKERIKDYKFSKKFARDTIWGQLELQHIKK